MKATRFNDLSIIEKSLLIAGYGIHLMSIKHDRQRIHLYAVNAHFVEVIQNARTRLIETITIAADGHLDKFLTCIRLEIPTGKITG